MPTEDELAKLRIAEEQKKIIQSTGRTRKLKQRQMIGEQAEEINQRKDHVEDAKKEWSSKGPEGHAHGADEIEPQVATKAKHQYANNLQTFAKKGQHEEPNKAGELPQDLKAKYDKPKFKMPSLFRKKNKTPDDADADAPKDKTAGQPIKYAEEFYKIEKEEVKMVGTSKHITITGIDQSGRRVTKTKIILPEQVGETKIQSQQGGLRQGGDEAASNQLLPSNFDGTYYSLVDIRQRRVPNNLDKNHREQYLSPEDFEKTFGMTKEAFSKVPKWKRDNLKRDLHLY
jgi:hypothetical protein